MRKRTSVIAWSLGMLLVACDAAQPVVQMPASTVVPTVISTSTAEAATATSTVAPTPTRMIPTPTPQPSATPTVPPTDTAVPTVTPTETPIPITPTPDVVAGLTVPNLRARTYGEGEITVGEVWQRGTGYTSYRISYPVDGLRLTGLLHVPDGDGPFPVIIANRGTIARDIYQPGMDSRAFSDLAARNGFVVVAPDFRGYGGGDDGPNAFYTGFAADVLGLIPLAQRLPMARPGKLGMWGHSRGASVTITALTITDQIAAAVAYAPAPADLAVDYERRLRNSGGNPGTDTWVFPPDANPDAYRRLSPITYLDAVGAPVMLHHGTADTTVDDSASIVIADTLRTLGKDVTLYLYEGQGHALNGSAYDEYAARTMDFFRLHLNAP